MSAGKISVVIAAYSPDPDRFTRVLDALRRAVAAAKYAEVETIVVRNGGPEISPDVLSHGPPLRLIEEDRPGIAWARSAGIAASSGQLIVFVDDDNVLAEDYLVRALDFAGASPRIGVFGGRIVGEFDVPPPPKIRPALPFLALRDLGDEEIHVSWNARPDFDVPGAGMALRRDVALAFHDWVQAGRLAGIGREGKNLASGDDTVCCRLARRMRLGLGYAPALNLTHIIPAGRIDPLYLRRLVRAIGQSAARIETMFDGADHLRLLSRPQVIARIAVHTVRHGFAAGRITSSWHLGYQEEARKLLAAHRRGRNTPPAI